MNQSFHNKLNSPQGDRFNRLEQDKLLNSKSTMFKLSNYCFQGLLGLGFVLLTSATPALGQVVINEVLYRQSGNSAAGNDEFIELYNNSDQSVDITGWQLIDGNLQASDTDGSGGSINDGVSEAFIFPGGTVVDPGEYVVVWIGTQTSNRNADNAAYQFYLGNDPRLNNTGDDVWLYDSQTQIIDYMAYGTGDGINTPPDSSLNLWDDTDQSNLNNASSLQSISLTPSGQDSNTASCWEATTSNDAELRCSDFSATRNYVDDDDVGRETSAGVSNNNVRISGRVFEDINYGGGPGRNFATAEASATSSGFPILGFNYATGMFDAVVELYAYDGINPNNSQFIQRTLTDDDGYYIFEENNGNPLPEGDYLIRVVNNSIESNRDRVYLILGIIAVQTFRNDPDETITEITNEVGGRNPAQADVNSLNIRLDLGKPMPTDAQSFTAINAVGEVTDVDFGFNFNTIVNTNDSGQGSLRRFIVNANDLLNNNLAQELPSNIKDEPPLDSDGIPVDLKDYETSIFMIPDPNIDSRVIAGTGTGQINLSNSPPDGGSGSAFVIDLLAASVELRITDEYTSIDGRTQIVNMPSVANTSNLAIGSNETRGTEIILNRTSGNDIIHAQISNLILHSLGIISSSSPISGSLGLRVAENGDENDQRNNITKNVIMEELTVSATSCGIQGVGMANSVIRNSVIRDSASSSDCNNIQLRESSSNNLIENNLILRSANYGVNFIRGENIGNVIRGNQIVGNGTNGTFNDRAKRTAGIGLRHSTNTTINNNIIRDNIGDGITITFDSPNNNGNLISQNSIYNNGDLAIDLGARRGNRGFAGDGLTENDNSDGDNGANTLQNFPEITNVLIADNNDDDIDSNDSIVIEGQLQSTPNSEFEIELFSNATCNPDRNGAEQSDIHGEGERFYESVIVNTDGNGLATFSSNPVVRSDLAGNVITATATATASNNTSEFSQCPQPNLLLVKRITAINRGQSDQRLFTNFVDDATNIDTDDKWLQVNNNTSSYLVGAINVDQVRPEDEVEYTIYFLSNGSETAENVLICDLIPDNMELVPNSFNSEPPAEDGLPGAARGLLWQYDGATESLTNANDGDDGYYFVPGDNPTDVNVLNSVQCGNSSSNTNGAVVINLNDLPVAKAPEVPANSEIPLDSYGFIRFRARVK